MPYVLGVDVGNSHTSAAFSRYDGAADSDAVSSAVVLPLDADSPAVPSVLYLAGDETVLIGRDALARVDTDAERIARSLPARVGDPISPLLGGRPYPAETLMAALVSWVVDRAVDAQGEAPDRLVLTHPANWGRHRRAVLDHALRQTGLADTLLLPKPVAAAESYAATHPLGTGDTIAIYDLGGSRLSCAVTRLGPAGFDLLSWTETGEDIAGGHFDDALTSHVLAELDRAGTELDPSDEELRSAMAELRSACRLAKETLSTAAEAIIPTPRLGPPSSVLIGRAQLEELISPAVYRAVDVLLQVIRSAGAPQLGAVVLVGGSARVPLVAELVSAAAPATVVVDPAPITTVARGAALAGRRAAVPLARDSARQPDPEHVSEAKPVDLDAPTQPPRPPVEVAPLDVPRRGARRWRVVSWSRRRTG